MGLLILNCMLPDVAPIFHTHVGSPSWSGKHVSELGEADRAELMTYCSMEAFRHGWNNRISKQPRESLNPFHQDFLEGMPHRHWEQNYVAGWDYCSDMSGAEAELRG